MEKLTMEPKRVFYYFEEISRIPRGSGNTKAISDYCVQFAQKHQLEYVQDDINNVIIYKKGSKGRETEDALILQGHLDMVCEKNEDCSHDFLNDGIELIVEGDWIRANGTTLGGDDGIAVAYCLAILENDTISHPPLEVVFTIDEETGLLGAQALDGSLLKGSRVLNIDSEEEGTLIIGCAGGVNCRGHLPVQWMDGSGLKALQIDVTGLTGGHSGTDINLGRGNANKLLGRILFELSMQLPFGIVRLQGGLQSNAIPRESKAVILVEEETIALVQKTIDHILETIRGELRNTEPNVKIHVTGREGYDRMLTPASTQLCIFLLVQAPDGVQEVSHEVEDLVETSLNLGTMCLGEDVFETVFAIRSSVESAKEALKHKVAYLVEFLGGECIAEGDYPAWEIRNDSAFCRLCSDAYFGLYGKKPQVIGLHAGLECGVLSKKIDEFDGVSMGPDVVDIHTPRERMSISSIERTWNYILEILSMA